MARNKEKIEEMVAEEVINSETLEKDKPAKTNTGNVKVAKTKAVKNNKAKTKSGKTKTAKKVKPTKKANSKTIKKEKALSGDITKVYAPKKSRASTINEELSKITNVMSKEQIKRPRKFVFTTCIYVALALSVAILCFIKFSKSEKVMVASETKAEEETTKTYIPKIDPIVIDEDLLLENDKVDETTKVQVVETTKVKESTKAQVKETAKVKESTKAQVKETTRVKETTKAKETTKTKETTKIAPKETEKVQETISASILSKAQTKKNEQTSNVNLPILNRLLPRYDTELYSSATYYQYSATDISEAFTQLTAYYKSAENKIWGDVSLDEKGINGKLYLNYTYMKKFIDTITDLDRSKYAALVEVQTTNDPVSFDFVNAKDMGLYYEVPANDGKNKLNLMILKGARVGFSQSFSLMTTLEILDLEWGTRHNPYFVVEDVVGANPKAKNNLTETAFRIDEMLMSARFNRIRYDKKGYITDLFYFQ